MDDGVYAALKGQQPKKIGIASAEKAYSRIESDFDVPLFAHEESLAKRGVNTEDLAKRIDTAGIREKIARARTVLTF